jgi:hypothetical protein
LEKYEQNSQKLGEYCDKLDELRVLTYENMWLRDLEHLQEKLKSTQ